MPASFRNGVDEQLRPALDVGFVILLRLVHGLRFITGDLQVAGTGENGSVDGSDGRVAGMQPATQVDGAPNGQEHYHTEEAEQDTDATGSGMPKPLNFSEYSKFIHN